MSAGRYNKRITIQLRVESQSASGEVTYSWADWREVWAEIAPSRGSQYFAAQQLQNQQPVTIRMRYMPGIRTDQRVKVVVEGVNQYYAIDSVIDPAFGHKQIELMCRMIESDGFQVQKDSVPTPLLLESGYELLTEGGDAILLE
jgi:SPP1 family predicted phage head-tail adaptor